MTTSPSSFQNFNEPLGTARAREDVLQCVLTFVHWLERFGEVSHDFQTFYAGRIGQSAKALYYRNAILGPVAVAPIIFCEAFIPSARRLFWKPQRFPIADAHYAMGFLFLARTLGENRYYIRAIDFLEILEKTRCEGCKYYCWGYPFHWETIRGTIRAGTPLITTVPYVYEAFRQAYQMDGSDRWLRIMRSIAQHALEDYKDFPTSSTASTCSYTPNPEESVAVVNANAYRAFLLTSAAVDLSDERYLEVAKRNLAFVIESQNPDGSWYYAVDGKRHFVDHFHTCFVLKALAKIEKLTADSQCGAAIKRGIDYYVGNLFNNEGAPKPFSRPPRLTIYRRELYDYAECLNLGRLLKGRFAHLDGVVADVLNQVLTVWQRADGSFRSRQLLFGWDNTPMHRWAQSQMFRSLCFWLAGDDTQSSVTIHKNEGSGSPLSAHQASKASR